MSDYIQLANAIAQITEEDLILFKVSAEEKAHIVKQFNRALINAQGEGTDVAQIFLKPLIAKYPSWGDAALVFGLCLAREYEFKRAEESFEFAINNVLSTEGNLLIAQEALKKVREDAQNPVRQERNPNEMQEKGSMISEMGAVGDRRGMQAPILMRASRNPAKAQMATEKERREIMMRAASSNGEIPDDDIMVDVPKSSYDKMSIAIKAVAVVAGIAALFCLIYFLIIPTVVKVRSASDNQKKIDYLTGKLSENKDDPEVQAIIEGYAKEFNITADGAPSETSAEAPAETLAETSENA